jgi:hypothetical protein
LLIAIISWVLLVDTHHSSFIQIFGTKKWASVPIVPGKSPSSVNHRTTWAIFHSYVKLPQGVLRYLVLGDYELAITNPYEWEACQPYEMGKRGMAQGFVAPCAACPYESMYVLVLLNLIETKYIPCGPNIPLFFFNPFVFFLIRQNVKCQSTNTEKQFHGGFNLWAHQAWPPLTSTWTIPPFASPSLWEGSTKRWPIGPPMGHSGQWKGKRMILVMNRDQG